MGALTSKILPFEYREWDTEYFESIDPTDCFGTVTRIYIKDNQIIQIEPNYNVFTFDFWITDKGRQFFDSIFVLKKKDVQEDEKVFTSSLNRIFRGWSIVFKKVTESVYLFNFFNYKYTTIKKFTVVFENVGLEILTFLSLMQRKTLFLKVKKTDKHQVFNDLEANFQLHLSVEKLKLNKSTFCLLLALNPRFEGYYLNLYLKKRFFKGNFECHAIGSMINLTFFTSFVGSALKNFKSLIEGNHLLCQKIKSNKKPFLILNTEFFKRADSLVYLEALKVFTTSNVISRNWNGINVLNYSLFENGIYTTDTYKSLNLKNLLNLSVLYFVNVSANNILKLKKIMENKILNFSKSLLKKDELKTFLTLNQSSLSVDKISDDSKLNEHIDKKNFFFLPGSLFYENEETFVNTKGAFCRTFKIVSKNNNIKNNWQILRKIFSNICEKIKLENNLSYKKLISPNFDSINCFKNFINFFFYASIGLKNLNFFLKKETKPFLFFKYKFKRKALKIYYTKLTYWLDNFFTGGRDEYSLGSQTLNICTNLTKLECSLLF